MWTSLFVFWLLTQSTRGAEVAKKRTLTAFPGGTDAPANFERKLAEIPPFGKDKVPDTCEEATILKVSDRYKVVDPVEAYGRMGQGGVFDDAIKSVGIHDVVWQMGDLIAKALTKVVKNPEEHEENIKAAADAMKMWGGMLGKEKVLYEAIRSGSADLYDNSPAVPDTLTFRNQPDGGPCFDACGPMVFGTVKEQVEFYWDFWKSKGVEESWCNGNGWLNSGYLGICVYMKALNHFRGDYGYGGGSCATGPPQITWYFAHWMRANTCKDQGKPPPMLYMILPDISFAYMGNPLVTANEAIAMLILKMMFPDIPVVWLQRTGNMRTGESPWVPPVPAAQGGGPVQPVVAVENGANGAAQGGVKQMQSYSQSMVRSEVALRATHDEPASAFVPGFVAGVVTAVFGMTGFLACTRGRKKVDDELYVELSNDV